MKLVNSIIKTAALAGSISFGATAAFAAPPSDGSTLGECYNNWISHCNQTTPGYPNSCYDEVLNHCDSVHSASLGTLSGYKVKSMQRSALTKAKRANTTLVAPKVQPVRVKN